MEILTAVTRNLAIAKFLREYSGPFRGTFSKIRLDIYVCKKCHSLTGLRANGLLSLYANCVPLSYKGVLSLSVGDESGNEGLTYGQLSFARAAVLLRWGIDHEVSNDRRRPVVVGLPLRFVALPDNLVVVLASVSIDTTFCLWLLRAHLRVILHPNLVRVDLKR